MKTRLIKLFSITITTIILILLHASLSYAQPGFWGMTSEGGADGVGTIFKTAADGTGHSVKYSFNVQNPGANPFYNSQLLPLANGKLYGVTYGGGVTNDGVLFEYDPATNVYSKKADFSNSVGRNPMGKLELGANGKLYGMASAGGANNQGTIFEFDPATNVLSKKIDLVQANGGVPYGNGLLLHPNGRLYGTTPNGGASGFGVLFEYDPATNTYTKKIDFTGAGNGAYPYGSLMITSAGKIFGMASQGGANNKGTLFEYTIGNNTLTKRFDFTTTSGSTPYSSLVEGNNNLLYGVVPADGSLFEFNPSTNVFTKKVNFNSNNTGIFPYGTPAKGANGKLYGTTASGGAYGTGVLYEYDIATNTATTKFDFLYETGVTTFGGMAQASNGNFYGVTYQGGTSSGQGVLYEYNPTTGVYTKKIELGQTLNGKNPYSGLTQAANKKLYGVTYRGGATNEGVLFEIDPITNVYAKKHDFSYNTGASPEGTLLLAANGNLYGMTSTGGPTGDGVLFEFNPATGSYVVKHEFEYDTGAEPNGNLMLASNNKLYGMTPEGGTSGYGVIFEFDPATGVYIKKAEFDNSTVGYTPYDALVEVSNGKFYGLCRDGGLNGNGLGTLFEYDLATNTITKKVNFTGPNGENPEGGLVKAPNGKLYGVTRRGGAYSYGILFEYDHATNVFTKKIDFGITSLAPSEPVASLALSANGKLYGSTVLGGSGGKGVLFEFDPTSNAFVKKHDFIGSNGASLLYGRLTFVKADQTITFNSLAAKNVNDPAFSLTASSTSLLPITFSSSNTSVATISGSTVTIVGSGTTTITASQAGDASFHPASDVTQILTVNKLNQTITFNALANRNTGDANFTLNATTTSGLPITYSSSNTAVASVSGNTVTIVGGGTTTITASQAGNGTYNPAIDVAQTLIIDKQNQTIIFNPLSTKSTGDPNFTLGATTTSGLPITYLSSNTAVATVSGSTVTIIGGGTTTITATQAGNAIYNPATDVTQTLTVVKQNQTITFSALADKYFGDADFTLLATASSGLGVTFNSSNTAVAIISGSTLTITGTGTTTITASQAGDNNYNAAADVLQNFTVNKSDQTISFTPITDKTVGDPAFVLTANTTSSLPASFSTVSNKISINGAQVSIVSAGRVTVTATQPGNTNYNAATPVEQSFCIKPAKPTITLSNLNSETPTLTSSAATGNQWYRNDVLIAGAINTVLTATEEGTYKVRAVVDDCVSDFSDEVVLVVTSLEENSNPISLFPNPTEDWLTVSLNDLNGNKQISIVNIQGSVKESKEVEGNEATFNVATYTTGVYFVKVKTKNSVRVLRFVKR